MGEKDNPEISIIMSVYNNERYLKEAIKSALNQTFHNIEIIFINDGSTDNSLKIARKLRGKDSRIHIFSNKKNIGKARAINRFIKKIKGAYVAFLDGDDILKKDRLQKQLRFMKKNKLDVSYCDLVFLYDKKRKKVKQSINFKKNFKEKLIKKSKKDFDLKMRPGFHLDPKGKHLAGFWGGFMFKKTIFKKCRIDISLKRMEDHDFWFQMIGKGCKINRFPKALYVYRQHPKQISKDTQAGDKSSIIINKKLKSGAYFKTKDF